uniref:RNA helicase n=1 Tax=Ditylenchus dipsaci TaxID=166011 RepID=A0A915E1G8_9BILA
MSDPLLLAYSIVMVDEAHERSVNTDLIVGLLRKIVTVRPDLRVIISSATIDAEFFRDFFELNDSKDNSKDTATIVSVEGRTFPVEMFYTKVAVPDYVQATIDKVLSLHASEGHGDILAFLTGQDEVEKACEKLRTEASKMKRDKDKLMLRVFDSAAYQSRKVVLCTNIAETSVTIPGICHVIDCGFVKMRVHNSKSDLETLMVLPISKSSADQRAGRAGRIRPGKCFRLYTESEYNKLTNTTIPEIQRGDLASVVLKLKSLGIQNILKFNYLSRPSSKAMVHALHLLYALGAIDDAGLLTNPVGTQMAELPLQPMHAKALISSAEFECSSEIAIIIAMMQIKDVFSAPSEKKHKAEVSKRKFAVEEGDHLTMLNVFSAFVRAQKSQSWCSQNHLNYRALCRVEKVKDQLLGFLKRAGLKILSCKDTIGDTAKIRRCLLTGFFPQIAYYDHTGSAIMYRTKYPKWVLFTDVMQNSIRDISEIEPGWIEQKKDMQKIGFTEACILNVNSFGRSLFVMNLHGPHDICPDGQHTKKSIQLTNAQNFDILADSFKKSIYTSGNSKQARDSRFQYERLIAIVEKIKHENKGHKPLIVDGLNVAMSCSKLDNQSPDFVNFITDQIDFPSFCQLLVELRKTYCPILVIFKHMLMDGFIQKLRQIDVYHSVCLASHKAKDDLFILNAALMFGPTAHVLSNDRYLDHRSNILKDEFTQQLFDEWSRSNFVRLSRTGKMLPTQNDKRKTVMGLVSTRHRYFCSTTHLLSLNPKWTPSVKPYDFERVVEKTEREIIVEWLKSSREIVDPDELTSTLQQLKNIVQNTIVDLSAEEICTKTRDSPSALDLLVEVIKQLALIYARGRPLTDRQQLEDSEEIRKCLYAKLELANVQHTKLFAKTMLDAIEGKFNLDDINYKQLGGFFMDLTSGEFSFEMLVAAAYRNNRSDMLKNWLRW